MSRDALFDLAVNRAAVYLDRLGLLGKQISMAERKLRLEPWYLRTRFAYRIPLEAVLEVIESYPGPNRYWTGGRQGCWQEGENPRP